MQNKKFSRSFLSTLFVIFCSCFLIIFLMVKTTYAEANATHALSAEQNKIQNDLLSKVQGLIDELIETSTNIGELHSLLIAEPLNLTDFSFNLPLFYKAIQTQMNAQTIYEIVPNKADIHSVTINYIGQDALQSKLDQLTKQAKQAKANFVLFSNLILDEEAKNPLLFIALWSVKEEQIKWRFDSSQLIDF